MISCRNFGKIILAVALTGFAGSTEGGAQSAATEQARKIDELFAQWDNTSTPGCTLSVMQSGKIIYKRAYGMANLDHDVVLTTETPFHVASVSKQFVAASIVLLEQDGKLSFDDEVRKYVPELPDFGAKITIRNLLHHTSGLRDQWDLLELAGWRYSLDLITNEDVMSVVTRQKELNFPPGSEYSYSNTGFTLLGEIVKRVSGKSLREFTTERIFVPLGMKNTHFRDDHKEIIKHQAYGYVLNDKKDWELSTTNFDTVGATSLFTTVEDLALWDENFYTGKVGGAKFTETMLHHDPLTSGKSIPYAFGLETGKYRGLDTVDHGGADAGYRSDLLRFPGQHFSVAALCNNGGEAGPGVLARKVADIVLAKDLKEDEKKPEGKDAKGKENFLTLSAEEIGRKTGYYIEKKHEADIWHIVVRDGNLGVKFGDTVYPLHALTAERFRVGDFPLEVNFASGANGLWDMTLMEGGDEGVAYGQAAPFTFQTATEKSYTGNYRSEEIDPVYRVAEENGRLVLKRLKHGTEIMDAVGPDLFRSEVGTLRFQRDAKKSVTGFMLTTGRVRNLRFTKER